MTQTIRKQKNDHTAEFRGLLERKRNELMSRLYQRRAELHGQDEPDDEVAVAVQSVVKELALTNIEREVRTLAEVELSLHKLETGEYGICGSCEQKIPEARLRALPWTRLCVECAGGGIRQAQEREPSGSSGGQTKSTTRLRIVPRRRINA